jgi:hypothetical protein
MEDEGLPEKVGIVYTYREKGTWGDRKCDGGKGLTGKHVKLKKRINYTQISQILAYMTILYQLMTLWNVHFRMGKR